MTISNDSVTISNSVISNSFSDKGQRLVSSSQSLHATVPDSMVTVFSITGLATEPSNQPTNLQFSSLSSSGMTLTWTASVGGADGYLVVRRSGASPTFVPVDQAEYTVSQSVGDGVVAYVGSAVTFADSGLSSDTVYYYDIFAYNGTTGTYNYLSTSPLEGNQYTYSAEPTAQPTNLQFANVTTTSIDLSWTAPSPVPTGYIVLRRTGASPTGTPTDSATAYLVNDVIGDSTVEYVGTGTSFTDSGLSDSTTYYYDVMSYNGVNWYNYLTTSPLEGSRATSFAFGNALHLDGSNDRVNTTVNSLLCGGNKASWLFWAKSDVGSSTQYLLSLANTSNNQGYLFGFGTSNQMRIFITNGASAGSAFPTISAGITNWNFYEIYYDGTQPTNATKIVLKVNGSPVTLSISGTVPTTLGTPSTP